MKQHYLVGFLLAAGIGAGCQQDKYLLEVYATTRYEVLKLPTPAEATNLLAVAFPSASVGFVGGAGGVLYTTVNGGQSWTSRTQAALGEVRKLYFNSATAGWMATSNGLYQTTNGGQTWQRAQYGTAVGPYGYIGAAWDVRFVSPQIGYAAGANGDLLKTTNGGSTWTDQLPLGHQRFPLRAVSFSSPDSGQVVGEEARYLTSNGGRTWSLYSSSSFMAYDLLVYGKGRYLQAAGKDGFSDNPGMGSYGDTHYVDDNLNWPIYALARYGGAGGPVAAVGENTLIRYDPDFSAQPDLTPWTYVRTPEGTSFRATFRAAAYADAHTLYAVGDQGALYRFIN
jgi:photosystem II stability/assembly factor-like uncharacterized protein